MSALLHEDWLPRAQRLAVGMKMRVRHQHERRPNLLIANEHDRWWAYCHSCHTGAEVRKEHVRFDAAADPASVDREMPTDRVPLELSPHRDAVYHMLARKGMDMKYFYGARMSVSERAKRLLIDWCGLHGRDLTDKSPAKWLHYNTAYVSRGWYDAPVTIVVEDLFSMFKVDWALTLNEVPVRVVCTQGTRLQRALLAEFLQRPHGQMTHLICMYDGDSAGDWGWENIQRNKGIMPHVKLCRARPPEGLDPKDLTIEAIRKEIQSCLT